MPHDIYLEGKLWCSFCQEKRDPQPPGNFCLECRHKMRTVPRNRLGKAKYKARLAERESSE
jgi:hypothetical protein